MNVSTFEKDVIDAAATEKEVRLTTFGRKTGKASDVTIFVVTDSTRIFILSGQGMTRHWPQNLAARGKGVLHLGGQDVKIRSRQVSDPAELLMISELYGSKYGSRFGPAQPGDAPRPRDQATFELMPAGS